METRKIYSIKNYKWIHITVGICIALLILIMGVTGLITRYYLQNNMICFGVTIAGQDISKMDKQDIFSFLDNLEEKLNQKSMVLKYEDKAWKFKFLEKSIFLDKNKTFSSAFRIGREGSLWEQALDILQTRYKGKNIPLYFYVNSPEMKRYLSGIGKDIFVKPHNALLQVNQDRSVKIIPEIIGVEINSEKTLKKLQQVLAAPKNDLQATIEVDKTKPDMTQNFINNLGIKNLISSYTTSFNTAKKNRSYNIKLSAEALNGTILKPDEVFSFNKRVGPRDGKKGYKNAPVIENGKLVDGIGGGVCQTSSTLYNSVLYADLEIIERINHSLPSTYVGLGRDATVDFNNLDFKFKNNTNQNLFITTYVAAGKITINIFGESFNKHVRIFTTNEKVIQPKIKMVQDVSLPKGIQKVEQVSKPGYQVTVWRLVEEKNKKNKREIISEDYYEPVSGIVRIGAGKTSQASKEDTNEIQSAVTQKFNEQFYDTPINIDSSIDIMQ